MSKLRKFARGKSCTLMLSGCNGNPETVVLCHISRKGFGKMGGKSDDWSGVHACSSCHDVIDGRVKHSYTSEELDAEKLRALLTTLQRVFDEGLIK